MMLMVKVLQLQVTPEDPVVEGLSLGNLLQLKVQEQVIPLQ
jgi:hypothetical protein